MITFAFMWHRVQTTLCACGDRLIPTLRNWADCGILAITYIFTMTSTEKKYKCGYCGWIVPSSQVENIISHSCFGEYDDSTHEVVYNENLVMTMRTINKNYDVETQDLQVDTETTPQNDDTDELLISLIASRPPLYDHRLPTQSRHKHKRAALWDEVYNMMGGSMSVNDITKRWKYLRDRYIRVRKECNKTLPSGSAANSQPLKKCPHYMLMQFLNDVLDNKRTISNIELDTDSQEIERQFCDAGPSTSNSMNSEANSDGGDAKPKRKKQDTEIDKLLLEALNQSSRPIDEVDGFLIRLGAGLQRLPKRKRFEVEIKYLQMLNDAEET